MTASTSRSEWISLLACADGRDVERVYGELSLPADYTMERPPETGLVMVQGRTGGDGSPFNLGEMTVTRCRVHGANGMAGVSCVAGHDERHAELAAILDLLLQDVALHRRVASTVLQPLMELENARRRAVARKAETTRVQFSNLSVRR